MMATTDYITHCQTLTEAAKTRRKSITNVARKISLGAARAGADPRNGNGEAFQRLGERLERLKALDPASINDAFGCLNDNRPLNDYESFRTKRTGEDELELDELDDSIGLTTAQWEKLYFSGVGSNQFWAQKKHMPGAPPTPMCRVWRDGKPNDVDSKVLVPGDVVQLEAGMVVPADLRIIKGSCECDESDLFGPGAKEPRQCNSRRDKNPNPLRQAGLLFQGTRITQGSCWALVLVTGHFTLRVRTWPGGEPGAPSKSCVLL
jgi:hypothetical protein